MFALTSSLESRVTRIRAPVPRVCIQVTTFYAEYRHFCNRINRLLYETYISRQHLHDVVSIILQNSYHQVIHIVS